MARPKRVPSPAVSNLADRRWFTTDDAAKHAQVSAQTIRSWIHEGLLPVVRVNGFRIDRLDLDRLLTQLKRVQRPYARGTHPWVTARHAAARAKRAAQ